MIRSLYGLFGGLGATILSTLGQANYTNTISLGSVIIGCLVAIGTIFTMAYGAKWKAVARTAIARGDELDKYLQDEKDRHEQASAERKELGVLVADQKQTIARLEGLPNLSIVIDQMVKEAQRQDQAAREREERALVSMKEFWAQHEVHADKRTEQTIEAVKASRRVIIDKMENGE